MAVGFEVFEHQRDRFKKTEDGIFVAVVKLLPDLVEGKYDIGIVERNDPLIVPLFPTPSVGMNDAFTKVGTKDLNKHCRSVRIDIRCDSLPFYESVNPLERVAVVAEQRV